MRRSNPNLSDLDTQQVQTCVQAIWPSLSQNARAKFFEGLTYEAKQGAQSSIDQHRYEKEMLKDETFRRAMKTAALPMVVAPIVAGVAPVAAAFLVGGEIGLLGYQGGKIAKEKIGEIAAEIHGDRQVQKIQRHSIENPPDLVALGLDREQVNKAFQWIVDYASPHEELTMLAALNPEGDASKELKEINNRSDHLNTALDAYKNSNDPAAGRQLVVDFAQKYGDSISAEEGAALMQAVGRKKDFSLARQLVPFLESNSNISDVVENYKKLMNHLIGMTKLDGMTNPPSRTFNPEASQPPVASLPTRFCNPS